jgi:hypothetical protein
LKSDYANHCQRASSELSDTACREGDVIAMASFRSSHNQRSESWIAERMTLRPHGLDE